MILISVSLVRDSKTFVIKMCHRLISSLDMAAAYTNPHDQLGKGSTVAGADEFEWGQALGERSGDEEGGRDAGTW